MKGQLEQYLLEHLPPKNEWVSDLEKQALNDHVPIMDRISIHFLMQLVSISKPRRILEIGTAIGYSALRMLEAHPSASIITIEKDACRYQQAIKNITQLQKQNHIQVIYGDAKEELFRLSSNEEKFDFVFIDAAKGEYQQYFELASSLLIHDGLIISDNILFRGYVAGDKNPPHRYKNLIKKIRAYNEWLVNLTDFKTTIVPIGDGLSISQKC